MSLEASPSGRWQRFAKPRLAKVTWVRIPPPPPSSAIADFGGQCPPRSSRRRITIMFYVYILECIDNKPYTGCTDNLKERLNHHNNGEAPATRNRLPVKLSCYFAFSNKYTAFIFEKYIKSASGRAFLKKRLV